MAVTLLRGGSGFENTGHNRTRAWDNCISSNTGASVGGVVQRLAHLGVFFVKLICC
jgi:hypothetical protein